MLCMLLSKVVKLKWNTKNRKYYENIGYIFTQYGDEFDVKVEDLTPSSKAVVEVECDFCHNVVVKKKYQTYNIQHHEKYGDCCASCQSKKNKLICMDKYGVDNGSKTEYAIEKIKQVSIERYGVDNPSKISDVRRKLSETAKANSEDVITKRNQTMLEKYGTTSPMDLDIVKEKQRDTLLKNYGVEHPKQSEEIKMRERQRNIEKYGVDNPAKLQSVRDKIKTTCLEKYGVECSLSSPDVRAKINKTLLENGNVKTSKQQLQLQQLLKEIYGACELNKPCGSCFLDCVIKYNGVNIDIEYDGEYWHQDAQQDRRRDEFVKSQGYKILRIRGRYDIPNREQLIQHIEKLVNSQHTFDVIEMV